MSVLVIPNSFSTGTTIQALPFNQNFSAIAASVNSVDNTQIGAAGLFASQLLPTTLAQATFGGLIGYQFLAPSSSTVPLTVSGVAMQTADLQSWFLTAAGTKALSVAAGGGLTFGAGVTPLSTAVQMYNDGASVNGPVINMPTSSTNGLQIKTNGSLVATVNSSGSWISGVAAGGGTQTVTQWTNTGSTQSGFYAANQAPAGTAINGSLILFANVGVNNVASINTSGSMGILGALSQSSLLALKRDITPISVDPLDMIDSVDWIEYNYKTEPKDYHRRHIGFGAENTHEYLSGKDHQGGFEVGSVAALACAAIKQLRAKVVALEAKNAT